MSQSVIVIPAPSADPVIGKWRKKYDHVALHGIPSHITLLFPFKDSGTINEEIIQKLERVLLTSKQFEYTLEKVSTFPGVIYLEPSPRERFIKITKDIVHVFPENLPYEGKYKGINPHATIAQIRDIEKTDSLKKQIEEDISKSFPIHCVAKEARLMIKDEKGEWHVHSKFPFLS